MTNSIKEVIGPTGYHYEQKDSNMIKIHYTETIEDFNENDEDKKYMEVSPVDGVAYFNLRRWATDRAEGVLSGGFEVNSVETLA